MTRNIRTLKAPAILAVIVCVAASSAATSADYPFHRNPDEIVVTRGDKVLRTIACERIALDSGGRWKKMAGHRAAYIRTQIGRASDGTLYVHGGGAYGEYWVVESALDVMFASEDEGRTWTSWNVDLPEKRLIGTFTVLRDDSFLAAATEPADNRVTFYGSTDRGKTWTKRSELTAAPFKNLYIDGNLLELQDGTLLVPLHFQVKAPKGTHWSMGVSLQFVMRSADGGRTWQGGPEPQFWRTLLEAKLMVAPVGPTSRVPGGTFPGCYETGLAQDDSGRLLAALRFSGPQWPWHKDIMEAWGGRPADNVGRIFRQVMFSTSTDGGRTWAMMQPFADAKGESVIVQQETNGQLLPLPDGRLVLIHQRRFGPFQIIARASADGGKTWLHDEYRLSAGFGFSGSLLLDDGTIVTVTGKSTGGVHGADVIRWRLPSKQELLGD